MYCNCGLYIYLDYESIQLEILQFDTVLSVFQNVILFIYKISGQKYICFLYGCDKYLKSKKCEIDIG